MIVVKLSLGVGSNLIENKFDCTKNEVFNLGFLQ